MKPTYDYNKLNKPLSEKENEVLKLIIKDFSNQDIADIFGTTLICTKKQVSSIMEKLGVRSRVGIVIWYYEELLKERKWTSEVKTHTPQES